MKGKVIVLFLRSQRGYGSPKRPYSMQQIHLKMHKSCTSVNDLPVCRGCPPAHLSNSAPQSDYGITKHTCRGAKGKGERCYEVRGPPVTTVKNGTWEDVWGRKEESLISVGSLKSKKGWTIKMQARTKLKAAEHHFQCLLRKKDLWHTSWEGKKPLTNTFNVRSSKNYLRGPGNRGTVTSDLSKKNPFHAASCHSTVETDARQHLRTE